MNAGSSKNRSEDVKDIIQLVESGRFRNKPGGHFLKDKILLLEKILSGLDAIIFIHDLADDRMVWVDGDFTKILGYELNEILEFRLGNTPDNFHPDDLGIIMKGDNLIRSGKSDSFSSVFRARHKDGHWVYMYYHISAMQLDKTGLLRYILGWALDFSSQINGEEHLSVLMAEHRRRVHEIQLKSLTVREKEIIRHLADGLSCKEISTLLGISYYTASSHIRNIHHKLGIGHLAGLIHFAAESGLST